MYLSKSQNIFVQITKCICLNHKIYLCKSQNVSVQQAWKRMMRRGEDKISRKSGHLVPDCPPWWVSAKARGISSQPSPGISYASLRDFLAFLLRQYLWKDFHSPLEWMEDSLRGIREFDSCLSAGERVEVFAQVSSIKMYLSQLQKLRYIWINC